MFASVCAWGNEVGNKERGAVKPCGADEMLELHF